MKLSVGSVVPSRTLTAVADGASVAVPDPDAGADRLIHLQFRRFAGCPVCHLHLRSVVRRHAEIEEAGIREVVVFHSTAEELREHVTGFPFAVIADPDKRLYIEYGVESSYRSLLAPAPGGRCCAPSSTVSWRSRAAGRRRRRSSRTAGATASRRTSSSHPTDRSWPQGTGNTSTTSGRWKSC
ncbi:peroxiredoxin-like family protein [Streptomyces nojiriensis]